jgi:glycosyltransferase involved in cell wall biosynthesis
MLFSILVPVYNSEKYLNECVYSVLRQSEQDFELILVNDGSLDGGGMLCDRFRAMYPNQVRVAHQPNRGLILARRAGIALAKGDFCIFLDADDALEPECLSTVRETIERTGADIVIYNNYSFFEEEQVTEPNAPVFADNAEFSGEKKREIYEVLISSWKLNNIWMKAIRTPLLQADDTPYEDYSDNPHAEDLLQTLYPVTHARHITYRSKQLYRYRRHSQSLTRRLEAEGVDRLMNDKVSDQLLRYMKLWGMDTPEYRMRYQARSIDALLKLFWQHFRMARTQEQKKELFGYDWGRRIDQAGSDIRRNRFLSRSQRLQVWALRKRNKILLNIILLAGTIKMRAAYGE